MQRLLERLIEEKGMRLKGGLYHHTQVKLAFNSNRIEGSRLSEDQTRYIYETNTVNTEAEEAADVDDIVEFHYRFKSIHPFQDGNGRVGRIIMFKECLRHDILPFIIDHERKLFYYRGLQEYEAEKGYLLDTCLAAQDEYEKVVSYFYPEFIESSLKMKEPQ